MAQKVVLVHQPLVPAATTTMQKRIVFPFSESTTLSRFLDEMKSSIQVFQLEAAEDIHAGHSERLSVQQSGWVTSCDERSRSSLDTACCPIAHFGTCSGRATGQTRHFGVLACRSGPGMGEVVRGSAGTPGSKLRLLRLQTSRMS